MNEEQLNLRNYKKVKLLDLVDIERIKKNKIYDKGNIIIQVSASRGQIFYLYNDDVLETKYVILIPKTKKINMKYLYYILQDELPMFLEKYQTNINIQPEIFKYLDLYIHDDIETQKHIVNILDKLDEQIKKEEELIEKFNDFKEYHLNKMFC